MYLFFIKVIRFATTSLTTNLITLLKDKQQRIQTLLPYSKKNLNYSRLTIHDSHTKTKFFHQ